MFPGGQPDMQQILQQAQQMQQDLVRIQNELAAERLEGTAGGGLVKATVTGGGELVGLAIDPKAADPEDTDTLADLVLAAVRDANAAVQRLQQERLGPLNQMLGGAGGGGLPGMPI